jgi:hypothetical protein
MAAASPAGGAAAVDPSLLGRRLALRRWVVRESPVKGSPKVGVLQAGEEIEAEEYTVDAQGRGWVRCKNGWTNTHAADGSAILQRVAAVVGAGDDGGGGGGGRSEGEEAPPPPSPDDLEAYLQPTAGLASSVVEASPRRSPAPSPARPTKRATASGGAPPPPQERAREPLGERGVNTAQRGGTIDEFLDALGVPPAPNGDCGGAEGGHRVRPGVFAGGGGLMETPKRQDIGSGGGRHAAGRREAPAPPAVLSAADVFRDDSEWEDAVQRSAAETSDDGSDDDHEERRGLLPRHLSRGLGRAGAGGGARNGKRGHHSKQRKHGKRRAPVVCRSSSTLPSIPMATG